MSEHVIESGPHDMILGEKLRLGFDLVEELQESDTVASAVWSTIPNITISAEAFDSNRVWALIDPTVTGELKQVVTITTAILDEVLIGWLHLRVQT